MHPATVSAILQLDYPDRLPKGHRNAKAQVGLPYFYHRPLLLDWLRDLQIISR